MLVCDIPLSIIEVIQLPGLKPVLVEVAGEDCDIFTEKLRKAVTENQS